jgi:3-methylcrotonyl-CoA carboxylase alpha subunit
MILKRLGDNREFEVDILAHDGATVRARVGDEGLTAQVEPTADGGLLIHAEEGNVRVFCVRTRNSILVAVGPAVYEFVAAQGRAIRGGHRLATPEVSAPMPGKVLKILVEEGQPVEAGEPLVVLEAMKMETTLSAESAAIVKKICVATGQMVDHGAVLIELSPAPD